MADYLQSFSDTLAALGERVRQLRLLRDLTQEALARDAGVGLKVLRRLEASGHGTTETALRVASALGVAEAFGALFAAPAFRTLAEVEAQTAMSTRKRARKRR